MRKTVWIIVALFLCLTSGADLWAQSHPVMRPDVVTMRKWMDDYENAPGAFLDDVIHERLAQARSEGAGTSINLLNYLQYTPSERSQGNCGDCWVWASTGVMEIALNVQNNVKNRLSTQLLQSCKTDQYACCGGNPTMYADWYRGKGFMVPWANSDASFQDGSRTCDNGRSLVACENIATTPDYPITSIQPSAIPTAGVGQAKAISNIKNILHQNKAVYWGFYLANNADWNAFFDMWNNHNESSVWNPDPYSGHTWVDKQGGGHAVLIVGYNDDDPSNSYWIVLNSWATASGMRPNGLFHLAMNINYDDYFLDGTQKWNSLQFYTFDVTFNTQAPVTRKPNLIPYQPSNWSDKIVVTNATGCTSSTCTDSDPLKKTDTLYVDWAVLNDSDVDIPSRVNVDLYVDGTKVESFYIDSLAAHHYTWYPDYEIGSLGPGPHDIKIVADSTDAIDESDETDNEYTKTIIVKGGKSSGADLSAEYAYLMRSCKTTWTSVSCTITGYAGVLNAGDQTTPAATHTGVYLYNPWSGDAMVLQNISTPKLKPGYEKDLRVSTKLPSSVGYGSGLYIVIVANADGKFDEPDWDNNYLWLGPMDPVTESYTNQGSSGSPKK